MEKKVNYEKVIDDEYAFARFSEDPVEQNRLNFEHAKKQYIYSRANNLELSEADYKVLKQNNYPLEDGRLANDPIADALLLTSPFWIKPAVTVGLPMLGNLITKYPLKSLEVGLTGLGAASSGDNPEDIVFETLGMKTDTMFSGGKRGGFNKYTALGVKELGRIIDNVFNTSFFTPKTVDNVPFFMSKTDDADVPFFMSKSDDATGGLGKFSKVTSPQYEQIVLKGMERMDMKDGVFDLDLYDLNSPILNEMTDPLGGTPMKSGQLRSKKLTKRNWLEYFLTPESLKGNFEALKKEGKVAANQTWEGFLKSKGLKTQAIQAHHINPLYDSIHLFDGVKWGSDEYWEMVTTLIDRGARPGITEREGVSNIIRTLGASARTDTPHGVAHEFYRDIMPTFFSKKERNLMKGNFKYRMEKTRRWAGIVNRSENVVYEAHKAWEALNPDFRISFEELVERMAKYDDQGILKGVHQNYQVPDIKLLVQQVQFDEFLDRLNIIPVKEQDKLKKRLPLVLNDGTVVDDINQEFLEDLASGMTKKDLNAKWGKKYNLKKIGAKQLNFLKDIRKITDGYE